MATILPRELTGNVTESPAPKSTVRRQRIAGVILVLVAALLYLATLDTGLQTYELHGGDLITHQYAQVQARPSNAPGYPIYTMGGWLWFHGLRQLAQLPGDTLVNPIPILSSYSTLWALLAIWLLYAIVCRLTRTSPSPAGNWPLAWLLAAFYAVTYFFWYYATTTEQYSSAIAQTLAILYVYLLWRDAAAPSTSHDPRSPRRHATHLLFLLAFLCGLSLAHMLTIAFIVPPLVFVILWQCPGLLRSPKAIIGSVMAAALPLLAYAFVYVRGAAHPEWWGEGDWPDARAWFFSFLSTAQGREELGWGFEPDAAFFGNGFPELIWQELSLPLLVLGLLGILLFDRKLALLLYATIGITVAFSWAYRYGNWYQVILPVYPLILLGYVAVAEAWTRHWQASSQKFSDIGVSILQSLPLILLAAAIIWRAAESLPAADSRNRAEDTAFNRAAILLDQELPTGTALFAAVDDALALQYLVDIWGVGGDHRIVSSREAADILQAESMLSTLDSTAILVDELPDDLPVQAEVFSPDWVILEQQGRDTVTMTPARQWTKLSATDGIVITEEITLDAFNVAPGPQGRPVLDKKLDTIDLSLAWQIGEGDWPDDLSISIRPTAAGAFLPDLGDESGGIIQVDSAQPVVGQIDAESLLGPTSLLDAYRLPFPPEADGILLILYRPTENGFENLVEIPLPVQ